jgi:hypothetical protein
VVGTALDADEGQVRVRVERGDEIFRRDEGCNTWEGFVEEGGDERGVCFESRELSAWEEERAGE